MSILKILHCTGHMDCAGTENFLMNVFRNIDRTKVLFDFCLIAKKTYFFTNEIKKLGGKIYTYPFQHKKNILLPFYAFNILKVLLFNKSYNAVHSHFYFINGVVLFLAWLCGIKKRVSHSHNSGDDIKNTILNKLLKFIGRKLIFLFATDLCACSSEAGIFLYGEKVKFNIIYNGIDCDKFQYNELVRIKIRKDMNINNLFVIGHIGRFDIQKNHKFLINIFYEYNKINSESILMLIGTGKLQGDIKKQVKQLGLEEKVLFLNNRKDIPDLLSAMDCFVLPSLYEGFGIVLLEAQCSGLFCFTSETISNDVKVCNIKSYSLSLDAKYWAKTIKDNRKSFIRKSCSHLLKSRGYNINSTVNILMKLYLQQ